MIISDFECIEHKNVNYKLIKNLYIDGLFNRIRNDIVKDQLKQTNDFTVFEQKNIQNQQVKKYKQYGQSMQFECDIDKYVQNNQYQNKDKRTNRVLNLVINKIRYQKNLEVQLNKKKLYLNFRNMIYQGKKKNEQLEQFHRRKIKFCSSLPSLSVQNSIQYDSDDNMINYIPIYPQFNGMIRSNDIAPINTNIKLLMFSNIENRNKYYNEIQYDRYNYNTWKIKQIKQFFKLYLNSSVNNDLDVIAKNLKTSLFNVQQLYEIIGKALHLSKQILNLRNQFEYY